jgi:RND family efflux transporter MFP subunit
VTQTAAETTLPSASIRVAVALLLCAGLACGEEEPRAEILPPIVAMQVAQSGTFEERWFPGRAKATREANIAFEVPGRLIERPVEVGDVVGKGQLLAKLDPRDFLNSLKQARAARDRAKAFRDRVAQAAKSGAVSRQELTDAVAEFEAAAAEVEIRAKALQDSELHAPFDGTVSSILVENYENVQAKQVTMRVLDTSKIEMVIDIPETLAPNLPHVKAVRVRFAALSDREFPAKIIEVGNEANDATRTYPVNLLIEHPADAEILPGMAGEASGWVVRPGEEAAALSLEVRISSLASDGGQQSYVWVVDPEAQTVSRREVEVGETTPRGIMVRGLERGEWVAVAGTKELRDGQKVRLVEQGERG